MTDNERRHWECIALLEVIEIVITAEMKPILLIAAKYSQKNRKEQNSYGEFFLYTVFKVWQDLSRSMHISSSQ